MPGNSANARLFIGLACALTTVWAQGVACQTPCRTLLVRAWKPAGWAVPDGGELELHRWLPTLEPYVDRVVLGWNFTEVPALRELDSSVSALDDIETLLRSDRDRDHAAWALVQVMQGETGGRSSDQAQAAALLYEGLHLPARPAAALLRSVRTPVSAKRQALRALRGWLHESEVKEAVRTVVCELAGKVDGLLHIAGVSRPVEDEYLADDESDLVSAIAVLYGTNRDGTNRDEAQRMLDYLITGLPSGNPVVRRLRTLLVGSED